MSSHFRLHINQTVITVRKGQFNPPLDPSPTPVPDYGNPKIKKTPIWARAFVSPSMQARHTNCPTIFDMYL